MRMEGKSSYGDDADDEVEMRSVMRYDGWTPYSFCAGPEIR